MDTVIQGGAELQPAGRKSEPTGAFIQRTKKAQEDLLKIIEYLAQRRALRQEDFHGLVHTQVCTCEA